MGKNHGKKAGQKWKKSTEKKNKKKDDVRFQLLVFGGEERIL